MTSNVLNIDTITWTRDSHGLFDYESNRVTRFTQPLAENVDLARSGNDVRVLADLEGPESERLVKSVTESEELECLRGENGRIRDNNPFFWIFWRRLANKCSSHYHIIR